jgi:hypothetical protein
MKNIRSTDKNPAMFGPQALRDRRGCAQLGHMSSLSSRRAETADGTCRASPLRVGSTLYLLGCATDRQNKYSADWVQHGGLLRSHFLGCRRLQASHPDGARSYDGEIARDVRYRTLDASRCNARRTRQLGATCPWETGPDAAETTPRFAHTSTRHRTNVAVWFGLAATLRAMSTPFS